MRVLFPLHGFVAWNGGLDLVRSMSSALQSVAEERKLDICYAVPAPTPIQRVVDGAARRWQLLQSRGASKSGANTRAVLTQAVDQIIAQHAHVTVTASAAGIVRAAEAFTADIVFPTMLPLGKTPLRRIGYVFDFQHRHLVHYFSPRIRRNRDRRFQDLAEDATGLVVNSRSAADDAVRFLGVQRDRILAMPFSPHAQPWWFETEPGAVRAHYGVGQRFLMVCNHFWVHKDHETALHAFAQVRAVEGNEDLELVLTGDPVDHRDPAHYGRLLELASALRISAHVHFLGLIPKRHQLALLRACEALVQPTRFEGGPGGGSVAEAIGLGVPSVVSDIPVNLEIDVGDVTFFRTNDAADLTRAILACLGSSHPRYAPDALITAGQRNLARLGHAITDYLLQQAGRA